MVVATLANNSSEVAEMGVRLGTTDMGQKVGLLCSFLCRRGELGLHLTQCRHG